MFSLTAVDGFASGAFAVHVGLQAPSGRTRFSLTQLKLAAPDFVFAAQVAPILTGSLDIKVPTLTITPDLFDLPTGVGLHLQLPDVHFTDYNSAPYDSVTNPRGLFITLPSVGGLGTSTA